MYLTDTAYIVVRDIPPPCSYGIPLADLDLHFGAADCASIEFAFMQKVWRWRLFLVR